MRGLLSLTALASTLAMASSAAVGARAPSCSGPVKSSPSTYWLAEQDHTGNPRGYAPNAGGNYNYPVWRNVLDYGAKNDGSGDQTASLQKAINDNGSGGSRESSGVTRYPAQVYLPSGTYQLGSTLNLRVGTLIVGDPINPPVIKAAAGFNGNTLVNGYDSKNGPPETSFMTLMKNVVFDTTALRPDTRITALQWGVAQGCGLTNVKINMPNYSTGHTGIHVQAGSTIAITDVVGLCLLCCGGRQLMIIANQWRCRWHRQLQPAGQLQEHPLQRLHNRLQSVRWPHCSASRRYIRELRSGHRHDQ
jgi:hypothetical protein